MTTLLQTKELTKVYGKQTVLNNINININRGKIYGLVGPNGAGKSTLLKIISGVLPASSGQLLFNPTDSSTINTELIIGSIIEEPALYKNLTAIENLHVLIHLFGLDKKRAHEVLREVSLENTGKKTVSKFSLGMKQRLGIACALLRHPELLILDEPTNGLDPIATKELRELILKLSKNGVTIIVSSHNLDEIQKIADEVGIIHQGSLIYEGKISAQTSLEDFFLDALEKNGGWAK